MSKCEYHKPCKLYVFNSIICNERGLAPYCGEFKHFEAEEMKRESKKSLIRRILNLDFKFG